MTTHSQIPRTCWLSFAFTLGTVVILLFAAEGYGEYTNVRSARRMSKGCALWGQACLGGHFKKRNDEVISSEMNDMASALSVSAPFVPKGQHAMLFTGDDYSALDNSLSYPWNRKRVPPAWRTRFVSSREVD